MFVSTDKGANFEYVDGSGEDSTASAAAQYATGKMCGSEIHSNGNNTNSGFNAVGKPAYKKGMASHNNFGTGFFNANLYHAVNVPANGGLVVKFDLFSVANDGFGNGDLNGEDHTLYDIDARLMVEFSGSDF